MDITIQLEDEQARKLKYIQQHTNQPAADVLNRAVQEAIESQYQELQAHELQTQELQPQELQPPASEPLPSDPLAKLRQSKWIGSIKDADPNLSANYKAIVSDYIEQKHDHR
jgi:predicted DNA-binding protein